MRNGILRRDQSAQLRILGKHHRPHAAPAQFADQPVTPEVHRQPLNGGRLLQIATSLPGHLGFGNGQVFGIGEFQKRNHRSGLCGRATLCRSEVPSWFAAVSHQETCAAIESLSRNATPSNPRLSRMFYGTLRILSGHYTYSLDAIGREKAPSCMWGWADGSAILSRSPSGRRLSFSQGRSWPLREDPVPNSRD